PMSVPLSISFWGLLGSVTDALMAGCLLAKSTTAGHSRLWPMANGASIRSGPEISLALAFMSDSARATAFKISLHLGRKARPSSVRCKWRVLRCIRVTPRWFSRLRTFDVTVAFAKLSDSAAFEKLPRSITRTKTSIPQSRSIEHPSLFSKRLFGAAGYRNPAMVPKLFGRVCSTSLLILQGTTYGQDLRGGNRQY